MADLFLHLAFARRLRQAEGLHPLVGEALARRPALVALGATLPLLPAVERKGMGFFRRLFARGSEAARWQKQLASTTPRPELVKHFLIPSSGGALGPMARLSLGLGLLSHELLEASVPALAGSGDRAAIERAQARLWLQAAVPNARDLEAEWRPVAELVDTEIHRRTLDHVDAALKAAFGRGPGRDTLGRWMKGLVVEVAPAALQGLPPSLSVADHVARGPHFENNGFVAKVQDATNWFVLLGNRLGERATSGEFDAAAVIDALCGGGTSMLQANGDASAARERWLSWQRSRRSEVLARGRNERPAFVEGLGEVKPIHRSNAFTGMLNISDIPQDALPPELKHTSLPPESSVPAPPVPAPTQEISLAAVAAAAGPLPPLPLPPLPLPPLPLDASGPVAVRPAHLPPTTTQEIQAGQIEGEARGFATPAFTQEISVAQIEAEVRAFAAPTVTQEISVAQIEAAAPARPDDNRSPPTPADPPLE